MPTEPTIPRLLVVDDSVEILDLLAGVFEQEGFAVDTANDGPSALVSCRAAPPDLVLLDLSLPGLDGFEVLRELKADARTADASVVVVSGSLAERHIVRALELGATDYVGKPYSFPILLARVRAVLRSRREKEAIWRLGEELRRAEDELSNARRNAAIGAIAAGLAHEINNPAAFVVTDLHEIGELAEELSADGDELRGEALGALAAEALDGMARIRDAVRDLSVFTQVVDRRSVPSPGALDLAEILRRRVERTAKGIELRNADDVALVAPGLASADELDALIGLVLRNLEPPVSVMVERAEGTVNLRIDAGGGEVSPDRVLTLAIARELAERCSGALDEGLSGLVLRLPRSKLTVQS